MHRDNNVSQLNSKSFFLKVGVGNGNEKQCSQMLGLGMGMKNSVPYQVGKQLKVGKNLGTEIPAHACEIYNLQVFCGAYCKVILVVLILCW